jgi:hypothetical protein
VRKANLWAVRKAAVKGGPTAERWVELLATPTAGNLESSTVEHSAGSLVVTMVVARVSTTADGMVVMMAAN